MAATIAWVDRTSSFTCRAKIRPWARFSRILAVGKWLTTSISEISPSAAAATIADRSASRPFNPASVWINLPKNCRLRSPMGLLNHWETGTTLIDLLVFSAKRRLSSWAGPSRRRKGSRC